MLHPSSRLAGIEFRTASANDADAIADVFALASSAARARRTAGDIRLLVGRAEAIAAVAVRDASVVGAIALVCDGAIGRLAAIAVTASQRNLGIGGALASRAESDGRLRGLALLHARVPDGDGAAWLLRRGYEIDREIDDVLAGRVIRVVELIKIL